MRFLAAFSLCLTALLATVGGVSAQEDPAELLRQYVQRLNQGDVDGVVALFAEDAVLEAMGEGGLCPGGECVGRAAIRRVIQTRVADRHHHTVGAVEVEVATATGRNEVRSGMVTAVGIERTIRLETVEVRDGQIVRYGMQLDLSDPETARLAELMRARRAGGSGQPPIVVAAPVPVQVPTLLPRTGGLLTHNPVAFFGLGMALITTGLALRRSDASWLHG